MYSGPALWLTLALFLPAAASDSCDDDVSQMLQKSAGARRVSVDESEHAVLSRVSAWEGKKRKVKKFKAHLAAPRIFAAIPSNPIYSERRMRWRKEWRCGEQLNAAGIPYKFIVGWPVDKDTNLTEHRQGDWATDSEAQKAELLREENLKYKDLHFVNLPDTYLSLQAKTFALLDYGYNLGAQYVMKMDDDTCIKSHKLLEYIDKHEAQKRKGGPRALYAGYWKFTGNENEAMLGRDQKGHTYFSGPFYVLSKDLIRHIVQDDEMNSVLWARYGTFDEDAETGRWVDFAEDRHKIQVNKMRLKHIIIWKNGQKIDEANNPKEF